LPSDVTYEGLFYDYYFDTGESKECKKLFCPSVQLCCPLKIHFLESRNTISRWAPDSGIKDFQRKKLNLVVVLDYSARWEGPFDEYYYDRFGNMVEPKEARVREWQDQDADCR